MLNSTVSLTNLLSEGSAHSYFCLARFFDIIRHYLLGILATIVTNVMKNLEFKTSTETTTSALKGYDPNLLNND